MTFATLGRVMASTLSLALIAGCQASPSLHSMKQPLFALDSEASTTAVTVADSGTLTHASNGVLRVSFQRDLAGITQPGNRRVQATVADIESVVVTVTPSSGADVSQTVLKAAIANGQTSVTFSGLAVGTASVTIKALAANGDVIGTVTRSATIVSGQVATVDIPLQLNPTYVPAPGGGSSGGSATGALAIGVTIQDGISAEGPYPLGSTPSSLVFDEDGNAWVLTDHGSSVVKVSPAGNQLAKFPIQAPGNLHYFVSVGANGRVYTSKGDGGGMGAAIFEKDGTPVIILDYDMQCGGNITFDAQGNGYFARDTYASMCRLAPNGTTFDFELPFEGGSVTIDSAGNLWVASDPTLPNTHSLVKMTTTGTVLGTYPLQAPAFEMKADGFGNVWVSDHSTIHKYSSAGQLVATVSQKGRWELDSLGRLWMRERARIACYGQDGTLGKTYAVPIDTWFDGANGKGLGSLNFDSAGNVWVVNAAAGNVIKFKPQ